MLKYFLKDIFYSSYISFTAGICKFLVGDRGMYTLTLGVRVLIGEVGALLLFEFNLIIIVRVVL